MQETRDRSLGQEDPLEKGMTTHSSILVWRIPWTEEAGGIQPMDHKESDTTEQLTLPLSPKSQCNLIWGLIIECSKMEITANLEKVGVSEEVGTK